jgi:hypothetical protein
MTRAFEHFFPNVISAAATPDHMPFKRTRCVPVAASGLQAQTNMLGETNLLCADCDVQIATSLAGHASDYRFPLEKHAALVWTISKPQPSDCRSLRVRRYRDWVTRCAHARGNNLRCVTRQAQAHVRSFAFLENISNLPRPRRACAGNLWNSGTGEARSGSLGEGPAPACIYRALCIQKNQISNSNLKICLFQSHRPSAVPRVVPVALDFPAAPQQKECNV